MIVRHLKQVRCALILMGRGADLTFAWWVAGLVCDKEDRGMELDKATRKGLAKMIVDSDRLATENQSLREAGRQAEQERDAAKAELAQIKESLSLGMKSHCTHCHAMFPAGQEGVKQFRAHIAECNKHPLAAITQQKNAALRIAKRILARAKEAEQERDAAKVELAKHRSDIEAADGELPVPLPEPGSDMAKLLHANIMMRKYRIPELEAERDELKEALRIKEANRVEAEAESIKVWDELQRQEAEVGRLLTRESQLVAENQEFREKVDELEVTLDDEEAGNVDTVEAWKHQKAEVERLRGALESAQHALKRASGLYTLGYNERHAEDQPDQVDETGISRKRYEQEAGRLCVMLSRTRNVVERALWPDSAANQPPASRIGCTHCEGDSVCSKCGQVKIKDDDGATD